jgi:hypothetical protein
VKWAYGPFIGGIMIRKGLSYYFLNTDGDIFHYATNPIDKDFEATVKGRNGIVAMNLNGPVTYEGVKYDPVVGVNDVGVVVLRLMRKKGSLFFTSPLTVNGEIIS